MRCFNGNLTNDAFKAYQQQMREEVASLTAGKMDNTDRDAWVDYYCSKYEIECLTIYPIRPSSILARRRFRYTTNGLAWCHMNLSITRCLVSGRLAKLHTRAIQSFSN